MTNSFYVEVMYDKRAQVIQSPRSYKQKVDQPYNHLFLW